MTWKPILLACALAFAPGSLAQAAPEAAASAPEEVIHARPALWVVKDADTTIYLFGTIHLLKPGLRWFEGPVRAAFDKSGTVVLEVAEEPAPGSQQAMMARAFQPGGLPLSNKLSDEAREAFYAALKSHAAPVEVFDHVKPWFAALMLTILPLKSYGYDANSGADKAIQAAAKAAGKTLVGLETSDEQLGYFDAMPEGLQLSLLNETLKELPTLPDTITKMMDAWAQGSPEKLAALMNESVDSNPEIEKILLTDRNARWADWIKARMAQPGTVFMAVGAGHLAGKGSVQDMLAQRGIKASMVKRKD